MSRLATAFLVATGMALGTPTFSGEFNAKMNIGDAAPAFKDLQGVDGKKHGLADYKKDLVVVVFFSNHCPIAEDYQERIIAFAKKYREKVDVVALNVSILEEDVLDKMVERAKEAGFNFDYLIDPSQQIGRAYGATVTPEFFLLNKERKIVFMGGMDDNNNAKKVSKQYLEPAVEAVLKGEKPPRAETPARGCDIRYEKKKKDSK